MLLARGGRVAFVYRGLWAVAAGHLSGVVFPLPGVPSELGY
jgi:hypothetical protein